VRLEGLGVEKNPMTLSGNESATFRLVGSLDINTKKGKVVPVLN
jgi:hypothetical protein